MMGDDYHYLSLLISMLEIERYRRKLEQGIEMEIRGDDTTAIY